MIKLNKINKSSIYCKIFLFFAIILILIIFKNFIYGLFKKDLLKESFNNIKTTKKYIGNVNNDTIYDDFYVEQYDDLFYDENKLDFEVFHILKLFKNKKYFTKLVDLGCGTGHFVGLINSLKYDTLGVDLSPHMINKAKDYYDNVNFKNEDILDTTILPGSSISILTSLNYTIYYMKNKQLFLQNCYHWLLPEGYLVIHLVNRNNFNILYDDNHDLDLYNNKQNNNKVIHFDKYKYKTEFKLVNDEGFFKEKFIDKKSNNVRENIHKFYIPSIDEILQIISRVGFKYVSNIDMGKCNYNYQYLYIFKKP